MDDEFASNIKRAKDICRQIIDDKLNIQFVIYNTVQLVDEELLALLRKAGCTMVRYGVETADQLIQKRVGKNLSEAEIISAFSLTREAGILADAFFMVGFPGEDMNTLKANVNLIRKMKPDRITIGTLFPKPYSRMYKRLLKEGRLLVDDWAQLFPGNYCMDHSHYKSWEDLRKAAKWLAKHAERVISWRDIFENRTRRNLYSRIARFLMTFVWVERVIRSNSLVEKILKKKYKAIKKLEI